MIATGVVNLAILIFSLLKQTAECCRKPAQNPPAPDETVHINPLKPYEVDESWSVEYHHKRLSTEPSDYPIKKRKIDNLDALVHPAIEDARPTYGKPEVSEPMRVVKGISIRDILRDDEN